MQIVGILRERRSGSIVLSNGTRLFLKHGVSADHIPIGRSVTVVYGIHDGARLADAVRLNSDWLLEAIEAAGLS